MATNQYEVTVIIPTLAEASRRNLLLRAIGSVLGQKNVNALPLLVINGHRFDPSFRAELEARTDIQTVYVPEGHVANAQATGVACVKTPFFAFLDDDDVFTDDALAHRLALMDQEPQPDLVVTNIYLESKENGRTLLTDDMCSCSIEPWHSIFLTPWLHSSNNLFRTNTISDDVFRGRDKYLEWTALAIKLSRRASIAFSNRPTAIYYDTPQSVSKTSEYFEGQARLMRSLPRRSFPRKTRILIDRKRATALNLLSSQAAAKGDFVRAWRYHIECLLTPGGWRFTPYTRKLLWPRVRKKTEL